jgi:hypothetical protein
MSIVLLIEMIFLLIIAITRALLIIINPSRPEKLLGVISSASILLPVIVFFISKDLFEIAILSIRTMISLAIFGFIFIMLVCWDVYKEHVSLGESRANRK